MASEGVKLAPLDDYNKALLAQVHPADWINPPPPTVTTWS